jgi:ubiquinone/menaquinone biosynthesis C-methylase UbiE
MYNKFYSELNSIFDGNSDFDFMNHGYAPVSSRIEQSSITYKTQASLYLFLVENINNKHNKKILDIGCGRGGGIKTISETYGFDQVFACDINEDNIYHCNNSNITKKINYSICDAQKLNYEKKYFDVILNVESMHCYQHPDLFLEGTYNILKDEGVFLLGNVFSVTMSNKRIGLLHKYFHVEDVWDITPNTIESCKSVIATTKNILSKNTLHNIEGYRFKLNNFLHKLKLYESNSLKFVCFSLRKKLF